MMQLLKATLCAALLGSAAAAVAATARTEAEADRMAAETLREMTLDEKLTLIGGHRGFYTCGIGRLGIPELRMADGPQGLGSNRNGHSTAYPATVLLAANWDEPMARRYGRSLGRDCAERGISFILGPGVNIYRSPTNGRNFEYMGEDPDLAARTAAAYIEGVQSNPGVAAVVKHFYGNNSEYDRHHVSNDIDERTLHEIYLPAFRAAISDAGVAAVMSSYNLTDGVWTAESRHVSDILRRQLGFKGLYMSDWEAGRIAPVTLNGDPRYFAKDNVVAVTVADDSTVYAVSANRGLVELSPGGRARVLTPGVPIHDPQGIFVSDGDVWIPAINGLYRYNRPTGRCSVLDNDPDLPSSISDSFVMSVMLDSRGGLWCGTASAGLDHTDMSTHRFKRTVIKVSDSRRSAKVHSIDIDRHGSAW